MSLETRRVWFLVSTAGLVLATTACSQPDITAVSAQSTRNPIEGPLPDPGTPGEPPPNGGVVESEIRGSVDFNTYLVFDGNRTSTPHDEILGLSAADIERWWGEQYPLVFGEPFEPLAGVMPAYPGMTTEIPRCSGSGYYTYEDIQDRLAFYCSLSDVITFDEGSNSLLSVLSDQFSPTVYSVMLSHEYGHAIQERAGVFEMDVPTIYTEQQADCYSGAWTGQAYNGNSPLLRFGDEDIKTSLIAMVEIRDPVGTSSMDPNAHGSAFDRVGAFQEGFLRGPARCAELIDDPLELIPNEFIDGITSDIELLTVGNAPYDCSELVLDELIEAGMDPDDAEATITLCTPGPTFMQDDLNDFWKTALDSGFPELSAVPVDNLDTFACDDSIQLNQFVLLCPSQQIVAYDGDDVVDLYHQAGDFTLGYLYSVAWAEAAQIYLQSPLTGEERALQNDCYTGAWVRDITPRPGGSPPTARDRDGDGIPDSVSSSPGDLDEATTMALLTGDLGANTNVTGTAFEKVAALRRGVMGGYDACAAQLPSS